MIAAAEARRQAASLARLRALRVEIAARALAQARAATALAEQARLAAAVATDEADAASRAARAQLGSDPGEAERLLALLDQARFRQAVADRALADARDEEAGRRQAEAEQRRGMIIAHARHAGIQERATALARRERRRHDEREQAEFDDRRRSP